MVKRTFCHIRLRDELPEETNNRISSSNHKTAGCGTEKTCSEQCCPICHCPRHCPQKDICQHRGAGSRINELGNMSCWGVSGIQKHSNFSRHYYCHRHSHYVSAHWASWNSETPDHHRLVWVLCLPSRWAHPWLGNELLRGPAWVLGLH